jgi:hypothetical protein
MTNVTIYRPQKLLLSSFGVHRSLPPSVASHRLATEFDGDTLFFDAFAISHDTVLCIGPPIEACVPRITISPAEAGRARARTQNHRIPQQFSTRTFLFGDGVGERTTVELEVNGICQSVGINADRSSLLANRRVVMTVSKDNPLLWIRDWAEFYVRQHGADAVLIYDNGSSDYLPEQIADALAGITGLAEIVIVPWAFPYGAGGAGPGEPALDNFCQTGALDHARRCLCRRSRSVLNVDVDELVVSGGVSIFERVEGSHLAVLLFHGIWVEAPAIFDETTLRSVRHRDCVFAWREQINALANGRLTPLCRSKWVCVPSRCSEQLEWGIHEIYPCTLWARFTRPFWRGRDRSLAYRHFRQINTGWKIDRWRSSGDFARRCVRDHSLSAQLQEVFGCPAIRGSAEVP